VKEALLTYIVKTNILIFIVKTIIPMSDRVTTGICPCDPDVRLHLYETAPGAARAKVSIDDQQTVSINMGETPVGHSDQGFHSFNTTRGGLIEFISSFIIKQLFFSFDFYRPITNNAVSMV